MKDRIYPILDFNQPPEQAGFRKKYSTVDHIHTVNQLFKKARKYELETNALFIDWNKAFDIIYHEKLWEALADQDTPPIVIKTLQKIYKEATAYVKLNSEGEKFPIRRGVRQGDPLSPNLFNVILEHAFRSLNWEDKGIKIDGKYLNNLRFADDVILLSDKCEILEKMASELVAECEKVGLEINTSKTKLLSTNPNAKIVLNNTEIEKVDEYKYLGQTIAINSKFDS